MTHFIRNYWAIKLLDKYYGIKTASLLATLGLILYGAICWSIGAFMLRAVIVMSILSFIVFITFQIRYKKLNFKIRAKDNKRYGFRY